jgi:hypothetical protein
MKRNIVIKLLGVLLLAALVLQSAGGWQAHGQEGELWVAGTEIDIRSSHFIIDIEGVTGTMFWDASKKLLKLNGVNIDMGNVKEIAIYSKCTTTSGQR